MQYTVREKFFSITGAANTITTADGEPAFTVTGKILSARGRMVVKDMGGADVATVERKLIALAPTYSINITGGGSGVAKRKLLNNPLKPSWTITMPGQDPITMTGNWIGREFTFVRGGQTVATVGRSFRTFSPGLYGVDVVDAADDLLVLCSVLVLEAHSHRR